MQSPQLSLGWVSLLQTLQATPQSFVSTPKVRLSREEEPQAGPGRIPWCSLGLLEKVRGRNLGSDVGVLCQGCASWLAETPQLSCACHCSPQTWPGLIPGTDPGSDSGARHSNHTPGTAPGASEGLEQTQGGQAGQAESPECVLWVSFVTNNWSPVMSCGLQRRVQGEQLEVCVFPLPASPLGKRFRCSFGRLLICV